MKELELKHLAPYLPYGLNIWCVLHETDFRLISVSVYDEVEMSCEVFTDNTHLDYIKPILRPLSDLTKEIEFNGEKFVPYDNIKEIYSNTPQFTEYVDNYIYMYGVMDSKCEYVCVQKLFEWHFDVFELIENDLAIDINTLNK